MTVDGGRLPLTIGLTETTEKEFWAMTRPAFPKDILPADSEAILKRATIFLNTERPKGHGVQRRFLYVRRASKTACEDHAAGGADQMVHHARGARGP